MFRVLDFFCGAGGFSEGFKQAGFNIVAALDNCQNSLDSHKANHPETEYVCKDILTVKPKELAKYTAEVILGSPPCQQFSVANTNPDVTKGLELTNCFLDLIESLNPRFWIMENVPGVVKYVSSRIAKLGGRIHLLNAVNYGTPQKRKRVFCGVFPFPYPSHSAIPHKTVIGTQLKKWVTVGEALKNVDLPTDENLQITDKALNRILAIMRKDKVPYFTPLIEPDKQYHTLTAHIGKDCSTGGIMYTSFSERNGPNFYSSGRPSPTLTTKMGGFHIINNKIVRRLSSVEAKVIMGFPEKYIILGKTITEKFKQIGNAVCPPVAKALAESIKQVVYK